MSEKLDRPLMGVRQYKVDDEGYLGSLTGRGDRWEPDKPRKAECERDSLSPGTYRIRYAYYGSRTGRQREPEYGPHSAPADSCECGYYSYYSAEDCAFDAASSLMGRSIGEHNIATAVVSAWGDVALHETGFRAEWMQAEAIIASKIPHKPLSSWIDLIALAERYAVPLIDEADVDTFCRERGEVLDSRDMQAERRQPEIKVSLDISELRKSLERMSEAIQASRNQPASARYYSGGEAPNR